jgi:hypothetical protein
VDAQKIKLDDAAELSVILECNSSDFNVINDMVPHAFIEVTRK